MNEKIYQVAIPELPEGWKAVAYRVPKRDELIFLEAHIQMCNWNVRTYDECVIVEKIQPRRIVLEETGQETIYPTSGYMYGYINNDGFTRYKTLREVKEGE